MCDYHTFFQLKFENEACLMCRDLPSLPLSSDDETGCCEDCDSGDE
jgi:hypothetical protein